MGKRVAIVGAGQTYHKSIRRDVNGQELINEAVVRALEDAELTIDDIDGVVIGNMDHFEGINYVDCWSIDGSGGFMKPVIKYNLPSGIGSDGDDYLWRLGTQEAVRMKIGDVHK